MVQRRFVKESDFSESYLGIMTIIYEFLCSGYSSSLKGDKMTARYFPGSKNNS